MSDDLRSRSERVLREHAAPALDIDGASIEVLDVEGGVARVRLNGACAGCPATVMALIMGLERKLRERLPEIEYLEAVP